MVTLAKRPARYSRSGAAYGAWPMDAGTTKAMRPPGRKRLAIATRKSGQEAAKPENRAPKRRQSATARSRAAPLNVW